jgi:hypothetical protein
VAEAGGLCFHCRVFLRAVTERSGREDVVVLPADVATSPHAVARVRSLRERSTASTRVLVPAPRSSYSRRARELRALLERGGFEVVGIDRPLLGRHATIVARPAPELPSADAPSATIVLPCRNEAGNIAPAIEQIPRFCDDLEILFVEGHSHDGTFEQIQQVIAAHPELDIKATRQDGAGKGDAVRKGFQLARGDVLMILDADLTVPPSVLGDFYEAIRTGAGELVMGTRLVQPMEREAMRPLNLLGNRLFSWLFTWLVGQRITDSLCGTKVLTRHTYQRIAAGRSYFGDFDPFGDFDLIFGAVRLNLKILEIPVRYRARTYGTTQISRFRDGWLLLKMAWVAFRKLKLTGGLRA